MRPIFRFKKAFTIIELLIVIVAIGILASVTLVSYSGISQRAVVSNIQTDLTNASKKLEQYKLTNGQYPANLTTAGITASSSNIFDYSYISGGTHYCLAEKDSSSVNVYSIASPMNQVRTGNCLTNGMYGWWKFNGDATDSSGNGNNGTVVGATLTADKNGNVNSAYNFVASSSQYIDLTSAQTMPLESATVSMWVKLVDNTQAQVLIYWGNEYENACGGLPAVSIATCGFIIETEAPVGSPNVNGGSAVQGLPTITTNTWIHVVGLWDYNLGYTKLYVNGVQNGGVGGTASLQFRPSFSKGVQRIGRPGDSVRYLNGVIDDVRIYYRVLKDSEITSLSQNPQ